MTDARFAGVSTDEQIEFQLDLPILRGGDAVGRLGTELLLEADGDSGQDDENPEDFETDGSILNEEDNTVLSLQSVNESDISAGSFNLREIDGAKFNEIKFLLTNARSLSPKINSFVDCVDMVGADITVVTESWLADGTQLEEDLRELEYGTDLCVVHKNRPVRPSSRRRTAGGGVAIIYNKTCLLYTSPSPRDLSTSRMPSSA